MNKIEFAVNWNGKLFLDNFGTIRLYPGKYMFGELLEVYLKNSCLGIAEVVAIKTFTFGNIHDNLAFITIGKNADYLKSFIRNLYSKKTTITPTTKFDHIIFQYRSRNIEVFEPLLKDWWQSQIYKQPLFQNKPFFSYD
jgi:hypothetical protein